MLACLLTLCLLLAAPVQATPAGQSSEAGEGVRPVQPRGWMMEAGAELPDSVLAAMRLQTSNALTAQGHADISPRGSAANALDLVWPIRVNPAVPDVTSGGVPAAVTNYVDHAGAGASAPLDYACGTFSYLGHRGTDIAPWPFPWARMEKNTVQVVAGAPGVLVAKADGNGDGCSASQEGNYANVLHADGSIASYYHLKNGSVTTKAVGQAVSAGEYLGVVGNSGNSNHPHLHLELFRDATYQENLDPYVGSCAATQAHTLWAQQPDYRPATIHAVMPFSALPAYNFCGSTDPEESMPAKRVFTPGETLFVGVYLSGYVPGTQLTLTLLRPDGEVAGAWNRTSTSNWQLSDELFELVLAPSAVPGPWRVRATMAGQTVETTVTVRTAASTLAPILLLGQE